MTRFELLEREHYELFCEYQKIKAALEFYADPVSWKVYHHELSGMFDEDTPAKDDAGKKARAALGHSGEKSGG